ncbi:MAG: hypothetical protein AAFM91_04215 [Pseudomonadota bacterium]
MGFVRESIDRCALVQRAWWLRHDVVPGADDICLRLETSSSVVRKRIEWSAIKRVEVYKRDLLTTDLVCTMIVGPDTYIEANEEMQSWHGLLEALEVNLDGITPSNRWLDRVLKPPFSTNHEVIFENNAT